MAEVGVAASLAGLVSLGLQVCTGLVNYYNAYREAENDVECLCDETNHLTQTLRLFQRSINDSRIDTDQEIQVAALIESCSGRIAELDTELRTLLKYRKDERRSIRKTMSRTIRVLYPFTADTVRRLRERISKLNEILQQAGTSILISQSNTIQDTIDQFYTREDSKEIIRWLDPPSPRSSHLDASAKHRQQTGSWLLDGPEFAQWKSSPRAVLWIQGNAGCGKTVLCSAIINSLMEDCESQANAGIAYFYFDFNNQSIAQDHNRLLRSLVEQLSSQSGHLPKPLASLYQRCRNGTVQPTTVDLVKTLQMIIGDFSPFYLVIDAVDECKEKQEFLNFLNTIMQWTLPQIHVLATSRTDIDTEIRNRKWKCATVVVEELVVDADVEKHVLATLEDDDVLNRWDAIQQQVIATSLIKGANGNFRWVACQIGALRECHTLAELEDALNSLPATLEETYECALSAISDARKEAIRNVLRWLSFSARPIRLEEIAEVMAVDLAATPRPVYDARRRLIDPQRFFHTYSTLVRVLTVKTKTLTYKELRLAHLSVRDFLVSSRIRDGKASYYAIDPLSAHKSIAETCLTYLRQFDTPLTLSSRSPESYCLARYAAKHWPHHVQAVAAAAERAISVTTGQLPKLTNMDQNAPVIALIVEFLLLILKVLKLSSTSPQVKDLPIDLNYLCTELLGAQDAQLHSQILFYDPDTPWMDQPDIARTLHTLPSALYYAAHAGLVGSVRLLLAKGIDVNAVGGRYGTALQAAASKGHTDVVKVLLANGANVNQESGDYGNALQGACAYGHTSCARLVLDHGADINARGGEHGTALQAAAFNGYDQVVAMLIENGAEIDALDDQHKTPLSWAASEGHTETVRLLLDHGSDCMIRDESGWTALDECAPPGFDEIVQMLINHHRPIIYCQDTTGFTALHHTAGQRHESTVRILLESGMEVDAQNQYGRTALFQAVSSGHEDTVRLFLQYGADVDIIDESGWSALHMAAYVGHVIVGALLLDYGADMSRGKGGMTPLHVAVLRKNIDFVELLLEYDADVMARNDDGQTALDLLLLHQTGEVARIAWELGIENQSATITGLRIAASAGRDVRIRQLLERGADINARDEAGMTALLWAAATRGASTMKLLIENGADVNVRSDWGSTPLSYVHDDPELVALLLANGYNMDTSSAGGGKFDDTKADPHAGDYVLEEIRALIEERVNEPSTAGEDTLSSSGDSE
ncbi:uncharacterized protein A1O5_03774 [Cladophialophora psammophila CBS 110553]|uniref:NACHT domain-containing protein n=1 Tax=Cladophialophora psammophila CBS 110553 TaxID=1182543 RepID=W9WXD9_9EURO|nr:uncharacterized protein A1O5_03774 [Cladophialophora psammophila CBS 110553]EXJ72628.1 hypothetical protein A1O5_03774 [Cladophialophora psammophila CBS 110553]